MVTTMAKYEIDQNNEVDIIISLSFVTFVKGHMPQKPLLNNQCSIVTKTNQTPFVMPHQHGKNGWTTIQKSWETSSLKNHATSVFLWFSRFAWWVSPVANEEKQVNNCNVFITHYKRWKGRGSELEDGEKRAHKMANERVWSWLMLVSQSAQLQQGGNLRIGHASQRWQRQLKRLS